MAIFQTPEAARRAPIMDVPMAGPLHAQTFTFIHNGANIVAADDIIEIGALPAHAQLVEVRAIQIGMTAGTTFDVGFMSGDFSSLDPLRTSGDTIIDGVAINSLVTVQPHTLWAIPKSAVMRSIGVKLSANEAAGSGTAKRIHLTCYWRY